ncbi:hypothetical protein ABHF33_03650 [Chitinibacter sp. FCG-7]|uniref:Uncharacterized protein n=1 Tax=Chitinibacter mangrovi TaxID=3153927 RepID=A0AAU7FA57_9NEIS
MVVIGQVIARPYGKAAALTIANSAEKIIPITLVRVKKPQFGARLCATGTGWPIIWMG